MSMYEARQNKKMESRIIEKSFHNNKNHKENRITRQLSLENCKPDFPIMQMVKVGFHPDIQYCDKELSTEGLGNCIAIVAYDSRKAAAVMTHYDTMYAVDRDKQYWDSVSKKKYYGFDHTDLLRVKGELNTLLKKNSKGSSDILYCIGLGSIWQNIDPSSNIWMMRDNLIHKLLDVFNVEPCTAGFKIKFDVITKTMSTF